MHFKNIIFPVLLLLALVACGDAGKATVLYYAEQELGEEPLSTRTIVTADWLRFDEGEGAKEYVLYDRRGRVIYSINSLDTRILVMSPRAVDAKPPFTLTHRAERDPEALPPVGERPVGHYRLSTNGTQCYDLYAADGLLPDVVQALREYREALAGHQAAVLPATPKEFQTPCDLADNIFAPARHLAHGLPVRATEAGGRTVELVEFNSAFKSEAALFELPANYRRTEIGDLRGR